MAGREADRPATEPVLPPGMSPLDLVREQAAAQAFRARQTTGAGGPSSSNGSGPAPSKVLAGVGIVLLLAAVVAGTVLALGGGDDPPPSFSAAPVDPTVVIDGRTVDVRTWTTTRWPQLMAVAEGMVPLYSSELGRSRAVSSCAAWTGEVEAMTALPPAPDPVMESEFRAMVGEGLVALDACQSGDVSSMEQHLAASKAHRAALDARVQQLRPA